jgi:hypothetical protein
MIGQSYRNLSGLNMVSDEPPHPVGGIIINIENSPRNWVINPQPPELEVIEPVERLSVNKINKIGEQVFSYETLIKQLYGLPIELSQYLIINGIRANFISFQEIANMLSKNQIERYIIDPLHHREQNIVYSHFLVRTG